METPKKLLIFSQKEAFQETETSKKFFIFQEIELSSPKPKEPLIFQEETSEA